MQSIHENIPLENWNFCPGIENPGDLLTRGENLESIINNDLWWHGPEWLKKGETEWPENRFEVSPESETEMIEITVCSHSTTKSVPSVIEPTKYEKFLKLVRVTAYVMRAVREFMKRLISKGKREHKEILEIESTSEEIKLAEEYWCRNVQQEEFAKELQASKTAKSFRK